MKMVIHSQLGKIRPFSVRVWRTQVPRDKSAYFLFFWDFRQQSVVEIFLRYIDKDNPTANFDVARKSIFTLVV